jgi:hypothetical protein
VFAKALQQQKFKILSLVKTFLSNKPFVTNKKKRKKILPFCFCEKHLFQKRKGKEMCQKVFDWSILSFANSNNSQKETDCHATLHVTLFF